MIVVTVFLSVLKQIKFCLVQNRKENRHHDHIPFNVKGNRNIVFSVYLTASWKHVGSIRISSAKILLTNTCEYNATISCWCCKQKNLVKIIQLYYNWWYISNGKPGIMYGSRIIRSQDNSVLGQFGPEMTIT